MLKGLNTKIIGKRLLYLKETSSTNDEAKVLVRSGEKEGTVIIAETQTKGRGRLSRKWVSPAGGLYLSVILRPYVGAQRLQFISFLASLAIARSLKGFTKLDVNLKWPNDIVIGNKKVGGILCESVKGAVIIGIGVNLNTNLAVFPQNLKKQITSVKFELGEIINPEHYMKRLFEELEHLYNEFLHKKDHSIVNEWKSLCSTLGRSVDIQLEQGKVRGIAWSMGDRGQLLLLGLNGKITKVYQSDVIKVDVTE